MARLPRLALAGHAHYLLQRSVHGHPLARDEVDRQHLIDVLGEAARTHRLVLWAYALCDEELHLLASPGADASLGLCMQTLGRRYVAAFNRRHARSGALWGGRFKAAVIEDGEWLLAAMQLIDGRPDAQRSSAAHHLGQRRDLLLTDAPALWDLGNTPFERELAYRKRLEQGVPADVAARIQNAVNGGWVVGSAAFVADVASRSERAVAPRKRGRPRRPVGGPGAGA